MDMNSKPYFQMASAILSNLKTDIIYRIDIQFKILKQDLDALVGKTAHILFLDEPAVIRMIIYRFSHFFDNSY